MRNQQARTLSTRAQATGAQATGASSTGAQATGASSTGAVSVAFVAVSPPRRSHGTGCGRDWCPGDGATADRRCSRTPTAHRRTGGRAAARAPAVLCSRVIL
jgi:hypothetical protein